MADLTGVPVVDQGDDAAHAVYAWGQAPEVDTCKASIARVYDAFLGGKDNFASDQAVYDAIIEIAPQCEEVAKANRRWLNRTISYLSAYVGIEQCLDLGAARQGSGRRVAQGR